MTSTDSDQRCTAVSWKFRPIHMTLPIYFNHDICNTTVIRRIISFRSNDKPFIVNREKCLRVASNFIDHERAQYLLTYQNVHFMVAERHEFPVIYI